MEILTKEEFLLSTEMCPVSPEIKNDEWLEALKDSESDIVYII